MARSYLEYRKELQAHLPKGRFWTRAENSTLTKLLNAFGEELSRVELRGEDLIQEAFPTKIQETLEEWETDFAIPDEGKELASTDVGRREIIKAKLIATGQQNKEYFIEIANALGYTITIEGIRKSLVGTMEIGVDPVMVEKHIFYWYVNINVSAEMTEFFTRVNITQLIIDIRKRCPAHTIVFFRFTGVEFSRGFSHDFDCIPYYDGSSWPLSFNSEFSNAFSNNTNYDGIMLIGAFNASFDLSFDSYRGGEFFSDEFSSDFRRPT